MRIGYLLAYYRDAGSSSFGCTLPGAPSSCYGHNGDSEAIALDVEYDEGTKHWKLQEARYSQHGDFVTYDAYSCTFVYNVGCLYLVYPDKDRGYPRAYVAEGKHANYATRVVQPRRVRELGHLHVCKHGGSCRRGLVCNKPWQPGCALCRPGLHGQQQPIVHLLWSLADGVFLDRQGVSGVEYGHGWRGVLKRLLGHPRGSRLLIGRARGACGGSGPAAREG